MTNIGEKEFSQVSGGMFSQNYQNNKKAEIIESGGKYYVVNKLGEAKSQSDAEIFLQGYEAGNTRKTNYFHRPQMRYNNYNQHHQEMG